LQQSGITAPVQYEDRLYESSPGIVIEEVNGAAARFGADPDTLLVIGHEPVMSSLALGLADERTADSTVAQRISAKFPTSAIAVLRVAGTWAELGLGGAELVDFHIPR